MRPYRMLLCGLVLGAMLLAGCGDSSDKGASSATGNTVDRAFVAHMVPHHQSALDMANIAKRRASGGFVKQLADDILRTQSAEIAQMQAEDGRLKAAGVAVGELGVADHMMGMDGDVASLKSAKPFDPAFLRLMIPHHEGALVMSDAEIAKGEDPDLKALAQRIITAQKREIAAMRAQLGAG